MMEVSSEAEHLPDTENWVIRAQAHDDDAFELLIEHYQSMMFKCAWARLHDHNDVEDATQEAFVLAYRHLGELGLPRFNGHTDKIQVSKWQEQNTTENSRHRP